MIHHSVSNWICQSLLYLTTLFLFCCHFPVFLFPLYFIIYTPNLHHKKRIIKCESFELSMKIIYCFFSSNKVCLHCWIRNFSPFFAFSFCFFFLSCLCFLSVQVFFLCFVFFCTSSFQIICCTEHEVFSWWF